jgi:hypothetical protein
LEEEDEDELDEEDELVRIWGSQKENEPRNPIIRKCFNKDFLFFERSKVIKEATMESSPPEYR